MESSSLGSNSSNGNGNGTQSWWGGMTQARARIKALTEVLGSFQSLETLQASETPEKDLLKDERLAEAIRARLLDPESGRGDDNICKWLFETYQTGDPELRTLVLGFVPTICGAYLPRVAKRNEEPLAGFGAVLLALYTAECKDRDGRPITVSIPDLSQPSLYHVPRVASSNPKPPHLGIVSPPLEPQNEIKGSKRATIIGVALELFLRKIASMPIRSKIDLCVYTRQWAMAGCSWASQVDEIAKLALVRRGPSRSSDDRQTSEGGSYSLGGESPHDGPSPSHIGSPEVERWTFACEQDGGARVHLPLEILQPLLRILGHCLMAPLSPEELKAAASAATKALYARATHELIPEVILSTRSLLRLEDAAKVALAATTSTSSSTPSKPRKPEVLLTST